MIINRGLEAGSRASYAVNSVLTGCSADDDGSPSAKATETVTVTASVQPSASAAATTASTAPGQTGKLGQVLEVPFGTVRVLDYRAGVLDEDPSMDGLGYDRFDALDVKTCVAATYHGEPVKLSWYPWLADSEGGNYPFLDVTGPTFIPPVYPQSGQRTTPGQCARGWIVFGTRRGATVTKAIYENDLIEKPLVWAIEP